MSPNCEIKINKTVRLGTEMRHCTLIIISEGWKNPVLHK